MENNNQSTQKSDSVNTGLVCGSDPGSLIHDSKNENQPFLKGTSNMQAQ